MAALSTLRSLEIYSILLLIAFFCVWGTSSLFSQQTQSIYLGYDEIMQMQKNPELLETAQKQLSKTLASAPELMISSENVDRLGQRIAMKREIIDTYGIEDPLIKAIMTESTSDFISALQSRSETTISGYDSLIPLMDFMQEALDELIQDFHFTRLRSLLAIVKIPGLTQSLHLSEEDMRVLAKKILDNFDQRPVEFSSDLIHRIAKFGEDQLLRYIALLLYPVTYVQKEVEYFDAYRRLRFYIDLGRAYHGPHLRDKANQELLSRFDNLEMYFNQKDRIDILHRRILTTEALGLIPLIPMLLDYLTDMEKLALPAHRLQETAQSMIESCMTRLRVEAKSFQNTEIPRTTLDHLSAVRLTNPQTQRLLDQMSQQVITLSTGMSADEDTSRTPSEETQGYPHMWIIIWITIGSGIMLAFLALAFNPRMRARLYRRIGLTKRAIGIIKRLSFENPLDPDLHVFLAQLLADNDQIEEAMSEFRAASRLLEKPSTKQAIQMEILRKR